MTDRKVNVLVYSGNGATVESVRHCVWSLRRLLSPNYAVIPISGEAVLKEPWQSSCALLVMPGGADMGYCRTLNGEGNRRISQYVNRGGAYLGLCAGGYYGCARCEFEVGKPGMEVTGDRELAFFPGTCRGLAFPGFKYHTETGSRATEIKVNREFLLTAGGAVPEVFRTYYNGGGVFVDASKFKDRGVEVLASYTDKLAVDAGEGSAAIVYCKVGDGGAVLTSPHPEFAAVNLGEGEGNPDYSNIKKALAADDKQRIDFVKACLTKLGLLINKDDAGVPSLSRLHLSAVDSKEVTRIIGSWSEATTRQDGQELIKAENDTFALERPSSFGLQNLAKALPDAVQNVLPSSISGETPEQEEVAQKNSEVDSVEGIVDYDKVIKRIVTHESSLPESKETPYFNHNAFFSNLKHYNTFSNSSNLVFGNTILYGEVVTSTSTLLEKNPTFISELPQGLTATATTQVAGRGRGNNVWVSPPGSLMFSTLLRHPLNLNATAPVVFIQYLAALAIVSGIHNYDDGYEDLPVRLKWPNDIYALDPSKPSPSTSTLDARAELTPEQRAAYVKIGGILVNSSYSGGDYTVIVGIGLNTANAAPTTSLNHLAARYKLPAFTLEKLLASILVQFEILYTRFCATGFSKEFEALYYSYWLHAGQVVTLEQENGARARIAGITRDWGLLVAEELGWEDRPTGKRWELQSDSNSFDFFRGLLKRKV